MDMHTDTLESRPNHVKPSSRLVELMLQPFDELVELNLVTGQILNLRHVDGKYFVPILNEAVRDVRQYCARNMIHPDDQEVFLRETDPASLPQRIRDSETPGEIHSRFRYKLLNGGWCWVEQVTVDASLHGQQEGVYYSFLFDIESQVSSKKDMRASAALLLRRSSLTGLFQERAFFDRAKMLLAQHPEGWCMIAFDVENFKLFNEWYGRAQGDLLLASIGARLARTEVSVGGSAGYLGQDDFALFAPYRRELLDELYDQCHSLISERGTSVGFLPAFGVAMADGESSVEELYDHASLAARHAKSNFHTRIRMFDPSMNQRTGQEYQILSDFQKALKDRELFIMLQPQCLIENKRVVGAESLVRWRKADGQLVSPGVFVPVLEKYGFVTDLDKYVWEEVCRWQRQWIDGGHTPLPVSVNVSQIDIFSIDVAAHFENLIKKYDLPVDVVKIEITESAYVGDGSVASTVKRLREKGFLVLMDDFGSGYSSLNMLRNLNVDIIKLDAQFLRMQGDDRKGVHIMESIVNMAKTMGVPIIVEGVETKEETEFLTGLGCRYVQGYYFFRPMQVSDFEALIGDPEKIDTHGFTFKAKDQFHTREFLDQNVFSDVMLNNILGPVAFFQLHGEDIDCIRYNEQFCNEINSKEFESLLKSSQRFVLEEDLPILYGLLEQAMNDPLGGAAGVIRFPREDGSISQYRAHFFFLEEDDSGQRFYASVHDVTHLDRVNNQMRQVSVSRLSNDEVVILRGEPGNFTYQVTVHGLADDLGLTREEFEDELNNRSIRERLSPAACEMYDNLVTGSEDRPDEFSPPFDVRTASGEPLRVQLRLDPVHDKSSGVDFILRIRRSNA